MKRTTLSLALLFVAGGLLADPLYCCALPGEHHVARFSAPAMDCCPEGAGPGCAAKLEKAANVASTPASSATSVPTPAAALSPEVRVPPPGSTVSPARATVERPPRLHLLHSQLLI